MRRARGLVVRAAAVIAVLGVASGCGRQKLKSDLEAAAPGCRVEYTGSSKTYLRISPCADGESSDRAMRYIGEHCAEIRGLGITGIEIATWNAPGYRVRNWSPGESETCAMRCNGRGC